MFTRGSKSVSGEGSGRPAWRATRAAVSGISWSRPRAPATESAVGL